MTSQTIQPIELFGRLCTYLAEDTHPRREVFPLLARADASSFNSSLQRALQNARRRSPVQAFVEDGSLVVEGLRDPERVYRVGISSEGIFYVLTDLPWRNPLGNEIRTLAHTNLYVGPERMLRTTIPVRYHYSPAVELEKTFELDGKNQKLRILVDGRLTVTQDRDHTPITLERLL